MSGRKGQRCPFFHGVRCGRPPRTHFGDLVDYGFTAAMEDDLDRIADGNEQALPWLTRFYFGSPESPVETATRRAGSERGCSAPSRRDRRPADQLDTDRQGVRRRGDRRTCRSLRALPPARRGPGLDPRGPAPDELTVEQAEELLAAPSGDRVLGEDPETGSPVIVRAGRYGPYVQLGEAKDGERPVTASLFATMTPATVTLEEALRLLSLPRAVGVDPLRRGDPGTERQVRPVLEERHRHPQPRLGGSDLLGLPSTMQCSCSHNRKQRGEDRRGAAEGARCRPGHQLQRSL